MCVLSVCSNERECVCVCVYVCVYVCAYSFLCVCKCVIVCLCAFGTSACSNVCMMCVCVCVCVCVCERDYMFPLLKPIDKQRGQSEGRVVLIDFNTRVQSSSAGSQITGHVRT